MKWTVEFRHFMSWEENPPLMYVPKQRTTIHAPDRMSVKQAFYDSWDKPILGRHEILDIWEYK